MGHFKYDENLNFKQNFNKWFSLNTKEKLVYNEKPYEREEAIDIFIDYVRNEWQEDQENKNRS